MAHDPESSTRRRSRRVVTAPDRFKPAEQSSIAKRKRDASGNAQDGNDDSITDSEDNESDSSASTSHDEHQPVRRARKISNRPGRQPSSKRAKTAKNTVAAVAANRPTSLPTRPKKSVRIDVNPEGKGILYGMPNLAPMSPSEILCIPFFFGSV